MTRTAAHRLAVLAFLFALTASMLTTSWCAGVMISEKPAVTLLHVSFDPTRELFDEVNKSFSADWRSRRGQDVIITQSHGGSGKQARSVIDGLEADIVSLALSYDVDQIAQRAELIPADWKSRLPNGSSPFHSTIVFLVRKGNPKGITDWNDLITPGTSVIMSNPKTSGGARWNYLAAWGYASEKFKDDQTAVENFVTKLYANAPVLDTGARGSTNTFAQRKLGDVLVGWESDALLVQRLFADQKFELVYPSVSISAEPAAAVVDKIAEKRGTTDTAKAYLDYLYSAPAQEIIAKNYFRPRDRNVFAKHTDRFREIRLFTIDDKFGGWAQAHKSHFESGGSADRVLSKQPK